MDLKARLGFFYELEVQCTFVVWAADLLRRVEASTPPPHERVDEDLSESIRRTHEIWFALQTILFSAANLSKLLWGGATDRNKRAKQAAQRKPIRDALGVSDDSPLKPVDLRNSLEHFDDRIDDWAKKGNTIYAARTVGSAASAIQMPIFGNYNPETGIVRFWGDSMSVPEVVAEAKLLLPLARAEIKSPNY
jgi:hypothetical protein